MLKLNLKEDYIYESLTETFTKYKLKEKVKTDEDDNNNFSSLNNNYFNSIYEYEKNRQNSYDWDEPQSITPASFVIRELLRNLCEDDSNKDDIFKTFESFLQQRRKWVKFSTKDITELFLGFEELSNEEEKENKKSITLFQWLNENSNENKINEDFNDSDSDDKKDEIKIPGLFLQIGDYQKNIFSAIGSLNLLEKLLNDEYNPDYEKYLNIFQNLKIYQFNYM
jgi:hypothetical protein